MGLGKNILDRRKELHMTQGNLAEKVGVSIEAVSGWEKEKYSPSADNLVALAEVLNTTVDKLTGGEDWAMNSRIFNERNMSAFLKGKLSGEEWQMSAAAISIAKQYHAGVFRDGAGTVPYINHPLTLACQAFAMGIADDSLVAALLLHDVVEDNRERISFIDLPVDQRTREVIILVTKNKADPHFSEEKYYAAIRNDPLACLVKCMDRCNNLSTMYCGFTLAKIREYIRETEEYIMPLLHIVKETPKYNNAAWLLNYQMNSIINAYKRML